MRVSVYRHIFLLLLLLAACSWKADTLAPVRAEMRDTSTIRMLRPGAEAERSVFDDSKLKYKQRENLKTPDSENILEWLARKLFSKANYSDLVKTRQIIIWTVVIIALIVVIRLLLRSDLTRLTRKAPLQTTFKYTDISEDLQSINYAKQIGEALADKNYRLAIRWHYLELLYNLDKKQLIQFVPHKTGMDYRYELSGKSQQGTFTALNRIYDYVWYGEFVIDETDYLTNAEEFSNFKQQLHVQGK